MLASRANASPFFRPRQIFALTAEATGPGVLRAEHSSESAQTSASSRSGPWRPIEPALAMLRLCSFAGRQVPEMADPALLGLRSVPGHPDADLVRALAAGGARKIARDHDRPSRRHGGRGRIAGPPGRALPAVLLLSLFRSVNSLLPA